MIRWKCPQCEVVLRAPDNASGKHLPCPKCHHPQSVPSSGSAIAAKTEIRTTALPSEAMGAVRENRRHPVLIIGSLICFGLVGIGAFYAWLSGGQSADRTSQFSQPAAAVSADDAALADEGTTITSSIVQDQEELVRSGLIDSKEWKQYREQHRSFSADSKNTITIPAGDQDLTLDLSNVESHPVAKSDYYALATMASQFYRQDGKMVRLDPNAEILKQLQSSKNLRTQSLFQRLDTSLRQYILADELQRRATGQEEAAMGNFLGSLFTSDSDTLIATEMDLPGMLRVESLSSYYASEAMSAGLESFGNRVNANHLLNEADAERLAVWGQLLPEAVKLAAEASVCGGCIDLKIVRQQKTDFAGPFEFVRNTLQDRQLWIYGLRAVNESDRDLHNVTLTVSLEAVPSIDGENGEHVDDALKEPNYYFVPKWPAKTSLQLLTGNQWGSDGLRRSARGSISIWSETDKVQQQTIDFDDNLRNYVEELADRWNVMLDVGQHESVLNQLSSFRKFVPERLADLHRALTEIESAAKESRIRLAKLTSAMTVGNEYRGLWTFGKFSEPFSLRVGSVEPGNSRASNRELAPVAVELYQPDQPSLYRRMAGSIVCLDRKWQIQLTGQSDSSNRGYEKIGIEPTREFFPTSMLMLEKQGPDLNLQLQDSEDRIVCRSAIGDLLHLVSIKDFSGEADGFDANLASQWFIRELPAIAPLPSICFEGPELANTFELEVNSGEIARGMGDSNDLYAVEQVFLSSIQPRGISHSRNGEMRQWNLDALSLPKVASTAQDEKSENSETSTKIQIDSGQWLPMAGPIAVAADLKLIASRSDYGRVQFWDLKSKRPPSEADLDVVSMQFARRANQNILVAVTNKNSLMVWNDKGKVLLQQMLPVTPRAYACSADGRLVVAWVDGKIVLWQIDGQKFLATLPYDAVIPSQIQFSIDATKLMLLGNSSGLRNGAPTQKNEAGRPDLVRVAVVDIASGQELYCNSVGRMPGHVAVSTDWTTLLLTEDNGPIVVWDLKRGEPKTILLGHRRTAASLAISRDGHYAMSGGAAKDTCVIFWHLP